MAEAPDPVRFAAEQRAEMARNLRYVVSIDDAEYVFRLGELTAEEVGLLRQVGLVPRDLLVGIDAEVAALDLFAAVVWMARRHKGEDMGVDDYRDLLRELRFDQVITAQAETDPEPEVEFPDPPPSGGS